MNFNFLETEDISAIEEILLRPDGTLRHAPYRDLAKFTQAQLSNFCLVHGIYQLPTTELIEWLHNEIGGRTAIEIGSGNGVIGSSLGIRITDDRLQERPEIRAYYDMMRQPPIKYHPDIIPLGGNEAVDEMRPQVVIACWVTQLWKENVTVDGNMYGVDEDILCGQVEEYIHVGNEKTHATKLVLTQRKFETYHFDWLLSRSMSKEANCIYVYKK